MIKVPRSLRPWPENKEFISINNFGFGGSNAHCVLRKWAKPQATGCETPLPRPRLFVLSGNDEPSATKRTAQLRAWLGGKATAALNEEQLANELAHTLCSRRSHLAWRSAVVARSTKDLAEQLEEARMVRAGRDPTVAFVFTGQGAQWHGMGRELMASHEIYASSIRKSDDVLRRLGADFSLVKELSKDKEQSQVNQAWLSQPSCTAVQVALIDLVTSWGLRPSSVVGHSSGEIAAAYAVGAISHEQALMAAYHRGSAVLRMKKHHTSKTGAMLAVGCGKDAVTPKIKLLRSGQCVVACENSPSSVTVSGDSAAVDELAEKLEVESIFNRKLLVDVAYHSSHMNAVAESYREDISGLSPISTNLSFYSSLHGKKLSDTSQLDSEYWVQNLTRPVRFSTALKELIDTSKPDLLIEIGPHSALEGPVKQILSSLGSQGNAAAYLPSLRRNDDATGSMLSLAGKIFQRGASLVLSEVNQAGDGIGLVSGLTPYPWSGQRFWNESRASLEHRQRQFSRHDLLGRLSSFSSDIEPSWRNILRIGDVPWLQQHRMQGLTVFPFSGFASMAVEAASQNASMRGIQFNEFSLREMQVTRPLTLENDEEYELVLNLSQYSEGTRSYSDKWNEFRIHSYHSSRGWLDHCRGLIATTTSAGRDAAHAEPGTLDRESVSPVSFYEQLRSLGADYGPCLQNIQSIKASSDFRYATGHITVPDTAATMPEQYEAETIVNAAFLDQLFQKTFVLLGAGRGAMPCLYMPAVVREMRLSRNLASAAGTGFEVTVEGLPDLALPQPTEVTIIAHESAFSRPPSVVIEGLLMRPVKADAENREEAKRLCYKLSWQYLRSQADTASITSNGDCSTNGHPGQRAPTNQWSR